MNYEDAKQQVQDGDVETRRALAAQADVAPELLYFLSRDDDAVVRLGGDEFLLVLRRANEAQLAEVSARLRHEADAAPIGFTLGAAMKLAGTPLDAALSRADERLYEERARRKP